MRCLYELDGRTISLLREKRFLSVSSLAQRIGCTEETVRNIERGYRKVSGKKIKHKVLARTITELSVALNYPQEVIILPLERASNYVNETEALADVMRVSNEPIGKEHPNPAMFLEMLREQLAVYESLGAIEQASIVKHQIKQVCIFIESWFTLKAAEKKGENGSYYYADSSIVDHGIIQYKNDISWKSLLIHAGKAWRKHGGNFTRILFIEPKEIEKEELRSLVDIIGSHITNGHKVRLVNQSDLSDELDKKKNLGAIGGEFLVAATNQIKWDLDFTQNERNIDISIEQHNEIARLSMCDFYIEDIPINIEKKLTDIYKIKG